MIPMGLRTLLTITRLAIVVYLRRLKDAYVDILELF